MKLAYLDPVRVYGGDRRREGKPTRRRLADRYGLEVRADGCPPLLIFINILVAAMSVPSRMSMRLIPRALEPRVRIAYAVGWEGVITTPANQVLEIIHEFAGRLPALDALDRYFRVLAVPEPMQESVRNRTLPELDWIAFPRCTLSRRSPVGGCFG